MGVFYLTRNSVRDGTGGILSGKKVYDTYWCRGKPRQNYRQDDKVVFKNGVMKIQTNFKSPKVVHLLLQNVDKLWITFFVSGVVGNTFLIIFVSLNQTNYDKHIQKIQ